MVLWVPIKIFQFLDSISHQKVDSTKMVHINWATGLGIVSTPPTAMKDKEMTHKSCSKAY